MSSFYPGRHHCKECVLDLAAKRRKRDRDVSDEPESSWGGSLYVLSNPRIYGEVKVGRAACPAVRAHKLSGGQNFTLEVNHTYANRGYLETAVHRRLAPYIVEEGPSREWFRLCPEQADVLVQATILEDDLSSF